MRCCSVTTEPGVIKFSAVINTTSSVTKQNTYRGLLTWTGIGDELGIRSDIQSNFPKLLRGKILKFPSYFSRLLKTLLCWPYQCAGMQFLLILKTVLCWPYQCAGMQFLLILKTLLCWPYQCALECSSYRYWRHSCAGPISALECSSYWYWRHSCAGPISALECSSYRYWRHSCSGPISALECILTDIEDTLVLALSVRWNAILTDIFKFLFAL